MILNREQIEVARLHANPDLIDTARAFHDLRDAVLALHVPGRTLYRAWDGSPFTPCNECGDDYPCPTVRAVESMGAMSVAACTYPECNCPGGKVCAP